MMNEPLFEISRFAFDWAVALCDPADNCASYHKAWPLMRLLQTDGELPAGKEFFKRELFNSAVNGKVHVLIAGGADTGLLALLIQCSNEIQIDIRITAVDKCKTPLNAMRLYASRTKVISQFINCSISEIPEEIEVDLIIGHSVLPFIPHADRQATFNRCAAILRPNGRICLRQRLDHNFSKISDSWKLEGLKKQIAALEQTLVKNKIWDTIASKDDVLSTAEHFWTAPIVRHSITTKELIEYASCAGLSVDSIQNEIVNKKVSPSPYVQTVTSLTPIQTSLIVMRKQP